MDEQVLRDQIVALLMEGHAHVTLEKALAGLAPGLRGKRPGSAVPSIFEELEHLRLAQEDILRYTLDADWKSPEWPKGYWPERSEPTDAEWTAAVDAVTADLAEVCALVRRPDLDITSPIPHGEGRTYLRQVLLVADHNAYHLGQIVQTRKLLGAWPAA